MRTMEDYKNEGKCRPLDFADFSGSPTRERLNSVMVPMAHLRRIVV